MTRTAACTKLLGVTERAARSLGRVERGRRVRRLNLWGRQQPSFYGAHVYTEVLKHTLELNFQPPNVSLRYVTFPPARDVCACNDGALDEKRALSADDVGGGASDTEWHPQRINGQSLCGLCGPARDAICHLLWHVRIVDAALPVAIACISTGQALTTNQSALP